MSINCIDLKEFYEGLQGRMVQRLLRQHVRHIWPSLRGQTLVGFGYAQPVLRPLIGEAVSVTALIPAKFGAHPWPPEGKVLAAVCDPHALPLETSSVDRMIVLHGFDGEEMLDAVLSESWRVLSGQGRLIVIVPNRAGIWARLDHTPFGHGTPFSQGQMRTALRRHMFVPESAERALFMPPSSSRLMLAAAPAVEKIGARFFNTFGGVNIVEAVKQVYAGTPVPAHHASMRRGVLTAPRPVSRLAGNREGSA